MNPWKTELVLLTEAIEDMPITASQIRNWTKTDPELSKVYHYAQHGWPENTPVPLKPYKTRSSQITTLNGCLLWVARVIVPNQGRSQILTDLHDGHPGITKTKSLARMYTWWPKMEEDIEMIVKKCQSCQESQVEAHKTLIKPWKWPSSPWNRIHIDHAGPFMNSMFLIIVDSHTKWVDIFKVASTTSTTTIDCLTNTFARFGLPNTIVSDNGTAFSSQEFQQFVTSIGVQHITTAPYHPQSNGLAERMVQTFKVGMKKLQGPILIGYPSFNAISNNTTFNHWSNTS